MSRLTFFAIVVVLGVALAGSGVSRGEARDQNELAPPFAVTAGGAPLVPFDETGRRDYDNAFPWFGDFDGDGRPDLLVGQHRRPGKERAGALRIYKNTGQTGQPRLGDALWFDDLVPTGGIPAG